MLDAEGQVLALGGGPRLTWTSSPSPCQTLSSRTVHGGYKERLGSVFIKMESTEGKRQGPSRTGPDSSAKLQEVPPGQRAEGPEPAGPSMGLHGQ